MQPGCQLHHRRRRHSRALHTGAQTSNVISTPKLALWQLRMRHCPGEFPFSPLTTMLGSDPWRLWLDHREPTKGPGSVSRWFYQCHLYYYMWREMGRWGGAEKFTIDVGIRLWLRVAGGGGVTGDDDDDMCARPRHILLTTTTTTTTETTITTMAGWVICGCDNSLNDARGFL